jgi:hypothetical protein
MPTNQLNGNRARRGRSVRDVTGRAYTRLAAEQEAKQAAAAVDPGEVRRRAFDDGFQVGHDIGWASLATSLHNLFKAEGIGAVQEFLTEMDETDGTEVD